MILMITINSFNRMEQARLEKDYDKMDLIGKAIQALEDDIKLHKVSKREREMSLSLQSSSSFYLYYYY